MKKSILISIIILVSITLTGAKLFISDKSKSTLIESHLSLIERQKISDKYYSDKKLGAFYENGITYFRLFTPNAEKVSLILFDKVEDDNGKVYEMIRDENGVWETSLDGKYFGKYYNFIVQHKNQSPVLCLDPYAKAVASFNTYFTPRKGIIIDKNDYDWEDDEWIRNDWRDLIIYEMHVRDM
ncbi:MAG: pullulanase, partial [Ignavibacterium sp.]